MAVTPKRNSRQAAKYPDGSDFDERVFNSTESDDSGSDRECECGSPSKLGARAQSRLLKFTRSISSVSLTNERKQDAEAYLDKRVMTAMQERLNAVTMLPCVIYSLYFLLAGCWVVPADDRPENFRFEGSEWLDMSKDAYGNEHGWIGSIGCINSRSFPRLTAVPPLPVVAAGVAMIVHPFFSMLYHWKYATTVESPDRIKHWSRRLDHAFIHFASAVAAYATSGRVDYFILNAFFNLDSACKQFEERVRPRRNFVRTAISILLYILPVLVYGHYALFFQFVLLFTVGGWLFAKYPFGGYSHSIFHLVLAFLPHLVMTAATQLESSQPQISLAVKCAGVAG